MRNLTPLLWICTIVLLITIFSSIIGTDYHNKYPTIPHNYPSKTINEYGYPRQLLNGFTEPPYKRKEEVRLNIPVVTTITFNKINYPNIIYTNSISLNPVNSILGMEQANTTWSNLVNISSTSSRNGYPRYLNISTDGGLTTGKTIVIR